MGVWVGVRSKKEPFTAQPLVIIEFQKKGVGCRYIYLLKKTITIDFVRCCKIL